MTRRPNLRTHTLDQIAAWWHRVPCPEPGCRAPAGAPCTDRRSYDMVLYGVRVHPGRKRAALKDVT